MLIGMQRHVLDPNEQRVDRSPPGYVKLTRVEVHRGRAVPPGTWVEDADVGSVTLQLVPPADDRTPAGKMGYRVRLVGGKLPGPGLGDGVIPPYDVCAILGTANPPFLVFYWKDGATAAHPPFRFLLSVAAVDLAGRLGPRSFIAVGDPAVAMPRVDEIGYAAASLHVVNEGSSGWLLTDGRMRMALFDTEQDARDGLAVAKHFSRQGFVGRDNHRPNRDQYILHYWGGATGASPSSVAHPDRIPFNPDNLFADDQGPAGFSIRSGTSLLLLADNAGDAAAQLERISPYRWMCFIGRNNRRPNRNQYITTYWE